jgi:C-terminal processing protease CtpA/Prc
MPGGESIGLKIETGVEIVGKYTVSTNDGKKNPWQKSNIEIGDYIEKVNDYNVENNESLLKILKQLDESTCVLTIKRNNKLTLNKIIDIRISIANLQYLKDKTNKYINNRPPEETKVKILSIFNTK